MAHEEQVTDLVVAYLTHGLLRANVIREFLESASIS